VGAAGGAEAVTLRDLLVRHALALNLIRLVLALLVFADHAYVLGGYGDGISWPTGGRLTTFGSFAVGAFFALSGLLVTMSGIRRTPFEFLRSRFLRIVPAYATVVILSALVLAPLVWRDVHGSLNGFWTTQPGGPLGYVIHNLRFPLDFQYGINDVFLTTTPYGQESGSSVINGSLWTLPVEVRCYLLALFVVVIGRGLGITRTAVVALGFVCALLALGRTAPEIAAQITPPWLANTLWQEMTAAFLVGAVIGSRAHVLRVTRPVIGVAALVYVLASLQGGTTFRTVGLGSLAILLPVLAARLPVARLRVFHHDLSYGTSGPSPCSRRSHTSA
jgi:peptidoglycan/LPS O-acetylase OafA/YrhL